MAFILSRSSYKPMPSWMFYKQKVSTVNPKKTAVGYIPIIQAPASEHDTSNTVVKRVLHVAKSIEQQHLILTVDEALYPKCRTEVVRRSSGGAVPPPPLLHYWVEEYEDILIPCLGGLHMNFLGVIGRHMRESGLSELWVGCDFLGANAAQHVIARKGYTCAIRTLTNTASMALYVPGWG
ncbi:hypothetical protein LSH36_1780g00005 [Paralvinella palmiformis]|uniref:Uncharacterized protein n=1 Tax=Paralvinella palmiformis TaxID=53620 RepID=A0AAD9MLU9_9ANNE|nr:hypothetical protein LSH36_1780g00005 [Paralvinella palmiformis]